MQRLIEGVHKFRTGEFGNFRRLLRKRSQEGQNPHTLVITCPDSRVVAEELRRRRWTEVTLGERKNGKWTGRLYRQRKARGMEGQYDNIKNRPVSDPFLAAKSPKSPSSRGARPHGGPGAVMA